MMKVTIEIPDNTLVLTYQYVFESDKLGALSIQQKVLDSKALDDIRKGKKDDTDT